jgi:hypothetical protein
VWQSLASVDIVVSVDPADKFAAFKSEEIRGLSNLFWCKFSKNSALSVTCISPSKAVE